MRSNPASVWAIIHEVGDVRPMCDAAGCISRARALIYDCSTGKSRPLCLVHAARGREFNRRALAVATELKGMVV